MDKWAKRRTGRNAKSQPLARASNFNSFQTSIKQFANGTICGVVARNDPTN